MTKSHSARYSTVKFGRPDAQPRIIHAFSSEAGWERVPSHPRLTPDTAASLRDRGYVMVVVRWRLHAMEVLLSNYLGTRAVAADRQPR
jgi:hypothetical protein